MDAKAYLESKGFTEANRNKFSSALALHGDRGKLVEKAANEIFVLVECCGSSGRLYKTVESLERGKEVVKEIMRDEYAYYFFPIGTSFYICQDMAEFRVVPSDDTDNA